MNRIQHRPNFLDLSDGGDEDYQGLESPNRILLGDSRIRLTEIQDGSIDLSFWSPPYFVGKSYEQGWCFDDWCSLLCDVIQEHTRIIKEIAK